MANKYKLGLLAGLVLSIGILFVFLNRENNTHTPAPPPGNHPAYDNYSFHDPEKVIHFGVQPLYVPTGLVTETMKRDNILREALSDLGLELRFYPFFKGSDVNDFFRKGKLDVGIGGDMPAVTLAASFDILIPALIQYGPTSIVTRKPILVKDLRGKKIGCAFGSNAHFMLLNVLASENLSEKDIHLVFMDVSRMPDALHQGRVAAFAAWEPTVEITLRKYPYTADFKYLSSGYIYFSKLFSDRRPKALRHVLAAEMRAIHWLKTDRANLLRASRWALEAGQRLTGRELGLTAEQNARLAEKDLLGRNSILNYHIPKTNLKSNGTLHREYIFLKNIGKVPRSGHWQFVLDSFEPGLPDEIISNPGEYKPYNFSYGEPAGRN